MDVVLSAVIVIIHISYGTGIIVGCIEMVYARIKEKVVRGGGSEEVDNFADIVALCPLWTGAAA